MGMKAVLQSLFGGLWATDDRSGPDHSFAYSRAMNGRTKPSELSVQPGLTREDGGVVVNLPQNAVMDQDGIIWALGGSSAGGTIYRRTVAGVWSAAANLNSAAFGLDYRHDMDSLIVAGSRTASRIRNLSGAPGAMIDYYGASLSLYNNSAIMGFNVAANQEGSAATYVLGDQILEQADRVRYLQLDIEPVSKIAVFVRDVGNGDYTLTLHDGLNTTLASATILNAAVSHNQWLEFEFSPVRLSVSPSARTYHVHVTTTDGTGTLACSLENDLSSADIRVYADRLIQTKNGLHPIQRFLQYEVIGNGNYLSAWEPISEIPTNSEWRRHAVAVPSEYECFGLALSNEFIVGAFGKVSFDATSTPQAGLLIFWDGLSDRYNYSMVIPEGTPYALSSYKNVLRYYAGGTWYEVASPVSKPEELRAFPGQTDDFSADNLVLTVYPYAAATRRGVHYLGWPGATTNTELEYGLYGYGAASRGWPDGFSYDFVLSTGVLNYSAQNNLKISMVRSFGDLMLVGWQDDQNGGYGVDSVDNSSYPATLAVVKSMIFDGNFAQKKKSPIYVDCYYYLVPGSTITLAYSLDEGDFVVDTNSYSLTNKCNGEDNYCRFEVADHLRFHEIQVQVTVTHDGSSQTPARILSIGRIIDDNRKEDLMSNG